MALNHSAVNIIYRKGVKLLTVKNSCNSCIHAPFANSFCPAGAREITTVNLYRYYWYFKCLYEFCYAWSSKSPWTTFVGQTSMREYGYNATTSDHISSF